MDIVSAVIIGLIVAFLGPRLFGGLGTTTGLPTGNVGGPLSVGTYAVEATPAAPVPASLGAPATLSPNTNFALATAQLDSQEAGIGIGAATSAASVLTSSGGLLSNVASQTLSQSIPIIGAAIGAVAQILLGQHTARLKGAIAENQLIPGSVQAFDADIVQIVTAYNNGTATAQQCITALQQMNTQLYNYMKGNATGPGRAWRDCASSNGCTCNNGCTAECCVYWGDLYAAIYGGNYSAGMIPSLQTLAGLPVTPLPPLNGQPAIANSGISNGSVTKTRASVFIPAVSAPEAAYGNFSRAGYSVVLTKPV